MTPDPLIMIVDDDATVRKVLRSAFERAHFQVLTAEHGVDALAQLAKASERVLLILTDVVMPEMGGVALAEKALALPTPPRIMLMSGFNHDPARLRVLGKAPPFVQKPFDLDDLVRRVQAEIGLA